MFNYTIRKMISAVPVLIGVTILVFLVLHLTPGDPARILAGPDAYEEDIAAIRQRLGLNDPLYVQYGNFMAGLIRLDFGRSFRTGRPVITDIARRFPNTMELALVSLFWATIVGVVVGVYAAIRPGSTADGASMTAALLGVSIPTFWLGLILMLIFSYYLGWFPASGRAGPFWTPEGFRSIFLPAISLGAPSAAILARLTRSSLLEVLGEDYVRTAKAKGLAQKVVIYRHALRNALIPVVTITGLELGYLMGGALITEQVFAWPGLGRLIINGIYAHDYPTVQASILVLAGIFVLVNLVTDLFYAVLDPRIKYN